MGHVVLVHGAWHGAWCWDGVVAELRARGQSVVAVELPFQGWRGDVTEARQAIVAAGAGSVVVGHSMGGLVVSEAARGVRSVSQLIYLAAFMLDVGEDTAPLMAEHESELLGAVSLEADGVTVDRRKARELFFGDSDDAVVSSVVERLRPMVGDAPALVAEPPAWRDVPSTYVVCTRDRALPPSLQRRMAARAGSVVEWPTDHSPFLTRPADIAELALSRLRGG
jgi:pimeloyl-ACP methyl ester carboxylesterase